MTVDPAHPVRIYRTLKARPEAVFAAWITPKNISKWISAPAGDTILEIKTNAQPGTPFSFLVLRDGKRVNHIGEYIEIRPSHRLVFTWGVEGFPMGESRVAIDFEPNEDQTNLTLTHRGVDREYTERTQMGWEKIIAALEASL